jgi:hypothetical protein
VNEEDLIKKEQKIIIGEEISVGRWETQIRLAVEILQQRFPDKEITFLSRDDRNEIMKYWDKYGYAEVFEKIENSPAFKKHPRLQGNIANLKGHDIISYIETGTFK